MNYNTPMRWALMHAKMSPDPSTQIGGVLLNAHGAKMHGDCNRMARGVSNVHPDGETRWTRPLKYSMVAHCEHNTILGAAREGYCTNGSTLVCTWAACDRCAVDIIEAGVKRLVRLSWPDEVAHWSESIWIGDIMLLEAGIEVIDLEPADWEIPIRMNGELVTP
jgi:deoxycytidylate deaminase